MAKKLQKHVFPYLFQSAAISFIYDVITRKRYQNLEETLAIKVLGQSQPETVNP